MFFHNILSGSTHSWGICSVVGTRPLTVSEQDSAFPSCVDGHSALLALLSEVAGLPLICTFSTIPQMTTLHICLTASREGREGGWWRSTLHWRAQPFSICLCLHPRGQEHVSPSWQETSVCPDEYHRLCYPGRKESECWGQQSLSYSTAPSRGCCGTFVQPLFVS